MTIRPHARPAHPLAERNSFINQPISNAEICSFEEAKQTLPVPVLPDQPEWVALYWRAWEIIWGHLKRSSRTNGFVSNYFVDSDDFVHLWDAVIVSQLGVYGRRAFDFIGATDNLYAKQHPDGFIGRTFSGTHGDEAYTPFEPNSTGPNLLACNEWRTYRSTGDDGRLQKVFWPLLMLHHWLRDNRTWPDGTYWATGESSHLANQPRIPDSRYHHRHWSWVDATIQAAINCACLAQIAAHLEEKELSAQLKDENQQLVSLINKKFWNEETQFYQDVSGNGRFSAVKSAAAYWALLENIVPDKRLGPFVQHLRENWAFHLPHRIPSMSADSDGYNADTGNQWRGGVWPCLNFMILRGLRNVRQHALAHKIALNHLTNVQKVYLDTGYFWDHYAPEIISQGASAQKNGYLTCITPIAILLEDVIGISVDWPHRRVFWDRRLVCDQPYGVRNYPLGAEGIAELIGDQEKITVTTNTPFTLIIQDESQSLQTAVGLGTTEIDLT